MWPATGRVETLLITIIVRHVNGKRSRIRPRLRHRDPIMRRKSYEEMKRKGENVKTGELLPTNLRNLHQRRFLKKLRFAYSPLTGGL